MDHSSMEPIPINLRDAYTFGGDLHSLTANTDQDGSRNDTPPQRSGETPCRKRSPYSTFTRIVASTPAR